jgi:hypothetical protein
MEEEAQIVGPLTTHLDSTLTMIRGIANGLLASGELAEDSHAWKEVKRIIGFILHIIHRVIRGGVVDGLRSSLCLYLWFMFLVECSDNFVFVWIILYFV